MAELLILARTWGPPEGTLVSYNFKTIYMFTDKSTKQKFSTATNPILSYAPSVQTVFRRPR